MAENTDAVTDIEFLITTRNISRELRRMAVERKMTSVASALTEIEAACKKLAKSYSPKLKSADPASPR
jgi:hypothetical protein